MWRMPPFDFVAKLNLKGSAYAISFFYSIHNIWLYPELDKFTILEYILIRFLAWQNESTEIHNEIAEYLETLDDSQQLSLLEGGFLDPTIDPSFLFDLKHPFPRTQEVANRLLDKYKILSILTQSFLKNRRPPQSYSFFCDISPFNQTFEGYDLVNRCDYLITRSEKPFFNWKTYECEKDRKSLTILKKGFVDFRIRCSLPVVNDYDPQKESPVDYFRRKGRFPIMNEYLQGVSTFSIARNISEYLGLREVEKWAEVNLLKKIGEGREK
jgi:hypothetical protein